MTPTTLLVFAGFVGAVLWLILRWFYRVEEGPPVNLEPFAVIGLALIVDVIAIVMFALSAAFLATAVSR